MNLNAVYDLFPFTYPLELVSIRAENMNLVAGLYSTLSKLPYNTAHTADSRMIERAYVGYPHDYENLAGNYKGHALIS